MADILLINPNTSAHTTAAMLALARAVLPPGGTVRGATAARGPAAVRAAIRAAATGAG